MKAEERKIEHHHALDNYGAWLAVALKKQGIFLSVVGENSLHIKGEITGEQRREIRIWKRQLINALSPKCGKCQSVMKLIEAENLLLCPLACGSREAENK